jgi:hypothetical protein
MKNNYVIIIHIFEYLLIIWSRDKMIIIKRWNTTFTWRIFFWFLMKMKKINLGKFLII